MATVCVLGATGILVVEILNLSKESRMTAFYAIGGIISLALFVYLLVVLLKPEIFL
jgi:K+-transporting ATPase KdpF subunit